MIQAQEPLPTYTQTAGLGAVNAGLQYEFHNDQYVLHWPNFMDSIANTPALNYSAQPGFAQRIEPSPGAGFTCPQEVHTGGSQFWLAPQGQEAYMGDFQSLEGQQAQEASVADAHGFGSPQPQGRSVAGPQDFLMLQVPGTFGAGSPGFADFQAPQTRVAYIQGLPIPQASGVPQADPQGLLYPQPQGLQAQGAFTGPDHQGTPQQAKSPIDRYMGNFPSQLKINMSDRVARVETQFPVTLTLINAPQGVERVHLPPHLVSKSRLLSKQTKPRNFQTLEMETVLVSADAMGNPNVKLQTLERAAHGVGNETLGLRICNGCILREHKRSSRKKTMSQADKAWRANEAKRVVFLSSDEYSDWERCQDQGGQVVLELKMPMRIACYCRHHRARKGFCMIFTLRNGLGDCVAQAISPPIFITDNHKDTKKSRQSTTESPPSE